ncbi:MAG: hypothetical protein AAFV95_19235 [Bacteroidota bacterium]
MQFQSLIAPPGNGQLVNGHFFQQACRELPALLRKHRVADGVQLGDALLNLGRQLNRRLLQTIKPYSRLTCRGYPLELAYVWPSNSFRFTVDLLPGGDLATRMQRSLEAVGGSVHPIQESLFDRLCGWHYRHAGKYGAWLGARSKEGKMSYKLYVEVPPGAPWQEEKRQRIGQAPPNGARLVMVGMDPLSGEVEYYYRIDRLNLRGLQPLMMRYGFPDRSREFIDLLQAVSQRHIRFEIPSSNLGYSISFDASEEAQTFTCYSVADSLLGGDSAIREAVLRLGRRMDWDMSLYDEATKPLAKGVHLRDSWHGMLGLVAARKGPVQFTIGWTPIPSK